MVTNTPFTWIYYFYTLVWLTRWRPFLTFTNTLELMDTFFSQYPQTPVDTFIK